MHRITTQNIAFASHCWLGQIPECRDRSITTVPEKRVHKFHWHLSFFPTGSLVFLDWGKSLILELIFSRSKCVSVFTKPTVKSFKLEVLFSFQGDFLQHIFLKSVLIASSFTLVMHKLHILCLFVFFIFFSLIIFRCLFFSVWMLGDFLTFVFTLIVSKPDWFLKFQRIFVNTDIFSFPQGPRNQNLYLTP